ncbi:TldD/PmbA family protein [Bdellovibrio bacteriovorus]|uniref:Putative Zn-dependent protease n=1 Tax=Bdellovibrio bacteriovorus (strain ATCC 15356 / DSM 50701 / NCIMB 9529 / HD100) TaxID=264462 RepID=Q6MPA1_BDEBA|nr:TldD/PmbA family protein [Bdellovibrio bacteriovorus]BEV67449.1 Metalloprotease TldD [Bdellovibrio bacteriovorus]CAE78897.1 putative Zn-dependent protease [Bdellovibrio bacteriovorus HD100]
MIIQPHILSKALDAALSTGADFADIFVEDTYSSQLTVLNSKADQAIVGQLYGAGIRLFFGHEIVYVTTNDLSEAGLVKAALNAAQSRGTGAASKSMPLMQVPFDSVHTFGEKPWEMNRDRKFKWLNGIDQHARARNSAVTQVEAGLNEKFQRVQIANSRGLMAYDERAYSRIRMQTFVESNGVKESSADDEGHMGTSEVYDQIDLKALAEGAVDRAMLLTTAAYAPAGDMPVLIDNAFGGVLFHEACGHGLETTGVAKDSSVFCGKMNQKIAHECVTAIDDGTIENGWGSLNMDDEGNKTKKTTLIENGVLKSYIVDEMGSRQTGYEITGSGRRQSYKYAPASRMRNTFIAAGKDKFEDMVRDVDYGLYAKRMGGGSVNPGTGDYNFQVAEGYIIRNGRIEEAVKGACLIGRGIDTLGKITKVSDDLKLARGMCGSVSGTIPAAVGQPQVLVSSLMVGGRAK